MTVSFNKNSGKTKIIFSWTETRQLRSGMIKIEIIRDLVDRAYHGMTTSKNDVAIQIN